MVLDNNILLLKEDQENSEVKTDRVKHFLSKKVFNLSLLGASCVLAIILLIMFFSADDSIKTGGLEIMSIQSVGGKTLEEAYYQNLGYIYEGYCAATKAIGLFCSSMLILFGVSRLKYVKK